MSWDVVEADVTVVYTKLSCPIAHASRPPGTHGTPVRKVGDLWDRAYAVARERGIDTSSDDWAFMYADDDHLHIYWEKSRA